MTAPVSEAVTKPSHQADKTVSRLDTESVTGLLPEAGIGVGVGLEQHSEPEPEREHQKGGRELGPRRPPQPPQPPRRTTGDKRLPQSGEQSQTVTEPITAGRNTNTDTDLPANAQNSPIIVSGIDTPFSPLSETATPIVRHAPRDRDRENESESDIEKERTPTTSDSSSLLSSLDTFTPKPKPILDYLPRNTSLKVLRRLMDYYEDQAAELELEVEEIKANRSRMMLWHLEPERDRDQNGKNRNRDRGGFSSSAGALTGNRDDYGSIRSCINLGQTNLETMHRISLHYQYQAHDLRLEVARIERDIEREEREREHEEKKRRRKLEREREGSD